MRNLSSSSRCPLLPNVKIILINKSKAKNLHVSIMAVTTFIITGRLFFDNDPDIMHNKNRPILKYL